jgi:hypothetical protein
MSKHEFIGTRGEISRSEFIKVCYKNKRKLM